MFGPWWGPNISRSKPISNPPDRLSVWPRLSGWIWWQSEHVTPSRPRCAVASAPVVMDSNPIFVPAAAASSDPAGAWHRRQAPSISGAASGRDERASSSTAR